MDKSKHRIVRKAILLLFFANTIISSNVWAQDFDWGTAIEVGFSKKLARKLDVGISQEFRLKDQASNLYRSASQLGIEYSFLRKICKVGLFGTFIRRENDQKQFENQYRLGAELSAKADLGSFNYSWRTRLLSTYRNESLGSYKVNPRLSLRNRFQIDYSFFSLPLRPYLSCEPFIYLNAQGGAYLDNLRYRIGTDYRVNKRSSWDIGLRFDQEVQVTNPSHFLSLDIGYKYKF